MKRKWLIGLLSIFMVLAMCFGFAACGGDDNGGDKGGEGGEQNTQTTDQATADAAIASLRTLYKDGETASAYKVLGQTKVDGTNYAITWTVTSDDVTNITDYVHIGTMDDTTKQITIDIVKGENKITYKLKATVTVGTASASLEVTKTIPAKPRDAKGTKDDPYSAARVMELAYEMEPKTKFDENTDNPPRVYVEGYIVDVGTDQTSNGYNRVGYVYIVDEYSDDKDSDSPDALMILSINYDANGPLTGYADLQVGKKIMVAGYIMLYQKNANAEPQPEITYFGSNGITCEYLEKAERTPKEKVEIALENVKASYRYNAVGDIDLPKSSDSSVTFAWESDNTTYTVGEGKLHIGSIPATDTLVTLTVTATCEGETATKQVKVTIKATPTQPQGGLLLTVDTLFPGIYTSSYSNYNGQHTVGTYTVTTNQVMLSTKDYYPDELQLQQAAGKISVSGLFNRLVIVLKTGANFDLNKPVVKCGTTEIVGTADAGVEDSTNSSNKIYTITYTLSGQGEYTISNASGFAMYLSSLTFTEGEDTRTPQQKVEAALAAVQTSYNVTTAGDYTLPTPTVDGVTFSWAKKSGNYELSADGKSLVIGTELPAEAADAVLTLTATYGEENLTNNTKDVTFHISAKPSTPSGDLQDGFNPLTAAPTQAGEYLIGMEAKGTWYYLTGATDGYDYRLKVSSNASEAATFTVEPEGDGFVIKYGTKYLEIVKNGDYVNSLYRDSRTAECVWKWNATYNTLTVDITGTTNNKDGTYFLGSYDTYTSNMSASFVSNLTKENEYPSRLGLYKAPAGGTTDPGTGGGTQGGGTTDPGTGGGTGGETQEGDATISFADTANRDSITAEEEVWTENGITVTHSKGTGNNIDTSKNYSNPIRIYKNHTLKIEYSSAITKIVFHSDKDYPANGSYSANPYYSNLKSVLEAAFPGATITSDDTNNVITLVLATPSKSVEFTSTVGQTRLFSLDISTETGTQGGGTGGGTGGDTPTTHVCGHVCDTCGKCTDESCTDPACADKCPGHSLAETEFPTTGYDELEALVSESGKTTTERYFAIGIVKSITDAYNAEIYITDAEGNELHLYGLLNEDGTTRNQKPSDTIKEGDTIVVYGVMTNYNGTIEMKDVWLVQHNTEAKTDVAKLLLLTVSLPLVVDKDFDLPVVEGVTYAVESGNGITVAGNKATVTRAASRQEVVIKATATVGQKTANKSFTVVVKQNVTDSEEISITDDQLLAGQAYSAYSAFGSNPVDCYMFSWTDVGNYGWLQLRKNKPSSFWNTDPFALPITKVEITWGQSQKASTENLKIELANNKDFTGAQTVLVSAVVGEKATVTANGTDYVYIRVTQNGSYAVYIDEVRVFCAKGTVTPPTPENEADKKIAAAKAEIEAGRISVETTYSAVNAEGVDLPTENHGATLAWAVKDAQDHVANVKIEGGKLKILALPVDADLKVTLIVTISCDGATKSDTAEVEITVKAASTGPVEPLEGTLELTSLLATTEMTSGYQNATYEVGGTSVTVANVSVNHSVYVSNNPTDVGYNFLQFKKDGSTLEITGEFTKIETVLLSKFEYSDTSTFTITAGSTTLEIASHSTSEGFLVGTDTYYLHTVVYNVTTSGSQKITFADKNSFALYAKTITLYGTASAGTGGSTTPGGGGTEPGGGGTTEANVLYTLDTTAAGGSGNDSTGYATAVDVESNGITWNVFGNTNTGSGQNQIASWRIGGKGATGTPLDTGRALTAKDPITGKVSSIVMTLSDTSKILKSVTVKVYSSDPTADDAPAATSTKTVECTLDDTTKNVTIEAGTDDWTNCYFQIIFNVYVTATSNKYFTITSCQFMK